MYMLKNQANYNNVINFIDNKLITKNYTITFPKSIVKDQIIINKDKFIDYYLKYFKKNHLQKWFFLKGITIIYDNEISKNDLNVIKSAFMELNFYKIKLISDKNLLKLNKQDCFLIKNNKLKLYYIDRLNNKRTLIIDDKEYTKTEIQNIIIKRIKDKNIFLINYKLDMPQEIKYYIMPNKEKYFINLVLDES